MANGLFTTPRSTNDITGYTPTTATAKTAVAEKPTFTDYDPKLFAVTPEQTVQGQINQIIAKDSPLMQQAETRAKAAMNARGLLNSSIGIGAGQSAVMEQAMPIAQQDAKTYESAHINTVNAQNAAAAYKAQSDNAARMRGAELGTNVNLANADAGTRVALANADAANVAGREAAQASNEILRTQLTNENQLANTRLTTQNQMAMAQLDANTRTSLTAMDNRYRTIIQTQQSAQNLVNQTMANLSNIANSSMSQAAKDAATATQLNTLNEGLRAMEQTANTGGVTGLNLGQYFRQVPKSTGSTGTGTSTGAPSGSTGGTPAPSGGGATAPRGGGTPAPARPPASPPSRVPVDPRSSRGAY